MAIDRFAASPEMYSAVRRHLETDGVPHEAANHLASEMAAHPNEMDTSVAQFQQSYEELKRRGYDDEAAQSLAVEAMEME